MDSKRQAIEHAQYVILTEEMYQDSWRKNKEGLGTRMRPDRYALNMARELIASQTEVDKLREALSETQSKLGKLTTYRVVYSDGTFRIEEDSTAHYVSRLDIQPITDSIGQALATTRED